MIIEYLKKIGLLLVLVSIQVLVLNQIHIFGYATPIIYIYVLLKLPPDISRNSLLLWGFSSGLIIDLFSNTPGMNAAACTVLALLLPQIRSLYAPKGDVELVEAGIHSMGVSFFAKYLFTAILVHHFVLLLIEAFTFFDITLLLLRIGSSTLLSFALILAIDMLSKRKRIA
ncbi:MAG: rod shape-determining protein MreD [Bacteroidaceae bacterium]